MVRKPKKHATLHGFVRHWLLADIETLGRRNAQELLEKQSDLTRRLRVNSHAAAKLVVIIVALGVPPGAHQRQKVRLDPITEQIAAPVVYLFGLVAHEQVTPLC